MFHIRISDQLKAEASDTLANFGLSVPEAVQLFLTCVVEEGGLPVGVTTDSKAHDAWFRNKVKEALQDREPSVPHEHIMREAQANIDRKRDA